MLAKSMLDPKDEEWTADQREQLRCYRTDIADTIMYSFNILRCANIILPVSDRTVTVYLLFRDGLLHSLLQHLDYSIKACTNNPAAWPPLEACLHAW